MLTLRVMLATVLLALSFSLPASTTSFHYAGTLTDSALPTPTGSYDFRVRLFDGAGIGASQIGSDVLLAGVPVTAGFFSVDLDFGSAILAPTAWLEFAVKASGDPAYETLAPRQQVGHVPLALYAETTDWSGVANVPQSLQALTDTTPPVIGKLLITPMPAGASPTGLVVHRIGFTASRQVVDGTLGPVSFDGLEVWIEPGLALPALMAAMTATTKLTKADLFLDLAGNVAATDYFAELSNAYVVGLVLEPGGIDHPDLVHATFLFEKVEFRIENGTDFSYDQTTLGASAVPGVCPGFISKLQYPYAIPGAGIRTLTAPNMLDGFVTGLDVKPGSGGTPKPGFNLPQWSAALDPATPTAARRLAICSLALAATTTSLVEPVNWSVFPSSSAKSDGWTLQIAWRNVRVAGFTLSSDLAGAVKATVRLLPVQIEVTSNDPDTGTKQATCWDTMTVAPCM